jgi:hypothetical protein
MLIPPVSEMVPKVLEPFLKVSEMVPEVVGKGD